MFPLLTNQQRIFIHFTGDSTASKDNLSVPETEMTFDEQEIKTEDFDLNIGAEDDFAKLKLRCQFCLMDVPDSRILLSEELKQNFFELTQEKVRTFAY